MDLTAIIATVVSFILGIGAVWQFLQKKKVFLILDIVDEALDVPEAVNTLVSKFNLAVKDQDLSTQEIEELKVEFLNLKTQIDQAKNAINAFKAYGNKAPAGG